jgi:hypothetical protein
MKIMNDFLIELESTPLIREDLPKEAEFIRNKLGNEISEFRILISESSFFPLFQFITEFLKSLPCLDYALNVGYDNSAIEFYKRGENKYLYGGWGCEFIIMKKQNFIEFYEKYSKNQSPNS